MASGFTSAEREAMRQRAEELRREKGGNKRAKNLEALQAFIDAIPAPDQDPATEGGPHLDACTWYGMPALESGEGVVVFLQVASKFGVRYSTLGSRDAARLDYGPMGPTGYAAVSLSGDAPKRIRELVRRAAGVP